MNSEKVTQNFLKTYKMKQLSSEKQKKRENENYLLRNLWEKLKQKENILGVKNKSSSLGRVSSIRNLRA